MIAKTLSAPLIAALVLAGVSASMAQAQQYGRSNYDRPRGSLEQRVAHLERLLDSRALIDMLQRLDTLERDIQRLQGEHEVQDHRLDSLAHRQQALQADLENRLQARPDKPLDDRPDDRPDDGRKGETAVDDTPIPPDGAPAGAMTADSDDTGSNAAPSPSPSPSPGPAAERSRYRQGFQLLRDSDLAGAITALEAYLQDYPQGRYAADARYWIADAHYVDQHFEQALRDFSQLISEHPDSSKVPKALFKIGLIYTELQQREQARQVFLELRRRYPGSTAARLAGEKLKGL